jgi:hypothetical protein
MASPHQANSDSSLHVQDCRIWAEIRYLDSPTDYREYLPGRIPTCAFDSNSFQILEASTILSRDALTRPLLFLVGIIAMAIFGYFLYAALDAL